MTQRGLKTVALERKFRSDHASLLKDFYEPCISQSVSYKRAAGFLSLSALFDLSNGISRFRDADGKIQVVVSPTLSKNDLREIVAGHQQIRDAAGRSATALIREATATRQTRAKLRPLGGMIASGKLELKLAVLANGADGIYHEKFGVFRDADGFRVAFHGSANETAAAFAKNFESLLVFRSWDPSERDDVEMFERDFDRLWRDETPGLEVLGFPEAARQDLIRTFTSAYGRSEPPGEGTETGADVDFKTTEHRRQRVTMPEEISLREYQRDALVKWFSAGGAGVLEMATGAGKTITAMSAFAQLAEAQRKGGQPAFAIVVCPYQHLVDQWADEARRFGLDPILCYRSRAVWTPQLSEQLRLISQGVDDAAIAIVTNSTFVGTQFQALAESMPQGTLLIADEVHNFGAETIGASLPGWIRYRLGLSATPDRIHDPEGTDRIVDYFGPIVYSYPLSQALLDGALTPYEYRVATVSLDESEMEDYIDLTRRLARAIGAGGIDGESAKAILIARSRLLASAHGKLGALARAISEYVGTTHNLVYCGDGTINGDTGAAGDRQIEAVVRLLGVDLGMRVATYTASTTHDQRIEIRDRFAQGDLQALVAIRCLDEGVDIPETERAFILASSSNPRQFIQRRGRVLRKSPNTGKKQALIHDFIVVPPDDSRLEDFADLERRLVQRELERVVEFASLATNGSSVLQELEPLRSRYGLLHI